ncbi:ArsR/SmtB family transcription factor [Paenibacillus sp. WLX2291]|uniref:ArsR/SmtB family transcription factor n=1 Tax=Paenibacillus sp. WLX2291 TaxID=3296934 RepID=UPI0039843DE7
MPNLSKKDELYQPYQRMRTCLESTEKANIMNVLSHGPEQLEHLASQLDIDISTISEHITTLIQADFVKVHQHGTSTLYSLKDPIITGFILSFSIFYQSQSMNRSHIQPSKL